jgi:FkbM family methyltransferase
MKYALRRLANRAGCDIERSGRFGIEVTPFRSNQVGKSAIVDIYRYLPPGNRTIFDVGANVGYSVQRFLHAFPGSSVYAFEPSPDTFERLKNRVGGSPGVRLTNCGVGSADGVLELIENEIHTMSSFLPLDRFGTGQERVTRSVPVRSLDSICAEFGVQSIDLLKSDTQGFELEVFRGAKRLMDAGKIGLVHCEIIFSEMYKNLPKFTEVCARLLDSGFSLVSTYDFHYQNGIAGWCDALFVHKTRMQA